MSDDDRGRAELLAEVEELRRRVAKLERFGREQVASTGSGQATSSIPAAQNDLGASEARLKSIMDAMPDGLYIVDRQYRIEYVNPAIEREFGPVDERKCHEYFHEFKEPCSWCKNPEVFAGKSVRWEWHSEKTGKTYDLSDTPFRGADGEICKLEIFHDITDRKRAEDKLTRAVAEFARSNRELEQFASVASHDLQEPLRMVASYTQLLAKRYGDQLDDDAKDFIGYAVDGANRMQRLIQDLLTYSRVGTRGKPFEKTDSHAALGEAIANLAAAIDESGAVVSNDELPAVTADRPQLVGVFQNLIGNAVKFRGEEPPRIHVSAELKAVSADRQADEWVFTVRDNGIGIAPEYHERIFEIFQRLHTASEYPGTGIGLALCKRIVTRHGGRIWVESEPGKGSTFLFTIPEHQERGGVR